jgi:hypothetical protein
MQTVTGGDVMGTKTLRVSDTGLGLFELREFRSKTGLLKRFRRFIENSDWDEEILRRMKWVDACSCAFAAAVALYIVCVSIFIIY